MKSARKFIESCRFVVLAVLLTGMLTGCQTTAKDFSRVTKGMEKDEVLDILGSPDRRQRWKGKDRWTYIYYDARTRSEHEIHFDGGIATYVGGKYIPEVSAEQQDEFNEASNREVEANVIKKRSEAARGLEDYETETRPAETDYVPSFEPVQ